MFGWRALVLLLVCAWSSPALAVDSQDIFQDYRVTAWGSADGLTSGTVWAIAQDAAGYLWLGTDMEIGRASCRERV